ncbi:unnamed protein product [Nesidiocoris tenuis]|uniref:Uncharacterized protein n=1 Tax=Nesidiocoris tenuis TaxID=355587 RepID=A0A6H5GU33_9HEMI|nr:unnamed protein product [Nesidiocoris tenuis]
MPVVIVKKVPQDGESGMSRRGGTPSRRLQLLGIPLFRFQRGIFRYRPGNCIEKPSVRMSVDDNVRQLSLLLCQQSCGHTASFTIQLIRAYQSSGSADVMQVSGGDFRVPVAPPLVSSSTCPPPPPPPPPPPSSHAVPQMLPPPPPPPHSHPHHKHRTPQPHEEPSSSMPDLGLGQVVVTGGQRSAFVPPPDPEESIPIFRKSCGEKKAEKKPVEKSGQRGGSREGRTTRICRRASSREPKGLP